MIQSLGSGTATSVNEARDDAREGSPRDDRAHVSKHDLHAHITAGRP